MIALWKVVWEWWAQRDIEQIHFAPSACSENLRTQFNTSFMSLRKVWGLAVDNKFWAPVKQMASGLFLLKTDSRGTLYCMRKNWLYRQPCPWMFGCCWKHHTPTLFFLTIFFLISHTVFIPPVSGLFPGLSRVNLPEGPPLGKWIR